MCWTTVLVFLGIELDSAAQLARLPSEKFASTLKILHDWERRRWCRHQELESLIGTLHHVCKIIPPGRAFLRRMINLLCCFRNTTHPIRLNAEFHRDLSWWLEFFTSWAGVSFFRMPTLMPLPDFFVSSDAAASLGCGAIWGSYWFSFAWPESFAGHNITVLELFPLVVAAHVWGHLWLRLQIEFHCDNSTVVAILNLGSSRDPFLMHLLRCLTMVACQHNFSFSTRHVPGCQNAAADALSRFHFQIFRRLHPSASATPTPVPHQSHPPCCNACSV